MKIPSWRPTFGGIDRIPGRFIPENLQTHVATHPPEEQEYYPKKRLEELVLEFVDYGGATRPDGRPNVYFLMYPSGDVVVVSNVGSRRHADALTERSPNPVDSSALIDFIWENSRDIIEHTQKKS